MKRVVLILSIFVFSLSQLMSQVLVNPGFENWTDSTHAVGWNSVNQNLVVTSIASLRRTTDKYSGNYAGKLITKTIALISQTIPGFANLGNLDLTNQEVSGGIPCTGTPTKVKGYFKYSPVSGDTMLIAALLYKYNSSTQTSEQIGYGMLMSDIAVNSYTNFEFDITYDQPGIVPDTMDIILLSSANETMHDGSTLFIDDISVDITPNNIQEKSDIKFTVTPNPASDFLYINTKNITSQNSNVVIYNVAGQIVYNNSFSTNQLKINLSDFQEGVYFVKISGNDIHKIEKLIIKHKNE